MPIYREVKESPMVQGVDEIITYTINTEPWDEAGTSAPPTNIAVVVKDETERLYTDVTGTVMPVNAPTADDYIITLSPLKLLTIDKSYRIEVKWTFAGNVFEAYCTINAER